MVGYDTKFERDSDDNGYLLSVLMHWDDDENPPRNRAEGLLRLKYTIENIEGLLKAIKDFEPNDEGYLPYQDLIKRLEKRD